MSKLEKLITEKISEGKSYNCIEKECGINHVSLAQYHKGGVAPSSKNLARLAKYFRVEPSELEEQPTRRTNNVNNGHEGVILRMLIEELALLTETQQLEWLLRIRKKSENA